MEIKYNEATLNRPEGDRLLDAPVVIVDLTKYSRQLKKEEAWKKSELNSITVYKSEGSTIVISSLHKKAEIRDIVVKGYLTIQVLDGSIDFTVKKDTQVLKKDHLVTLHPDIPHTIHAREESVLLLVNNAII